MPMSIAVTAAFTLLFSILIIYLSFQVVLARKKYKVGYGDGKQDALRMAIGAHSNAVENIPLALFLMLMLELNNVSRELLILFGFILLIARLIHAFGLSHSIGVSFGRTYGTMITWIMIILMAILNVVLAFS